MIVRLRSGADHITDDDISAKTEEDHDKRTLSGSKGELLLSALHPALATGVFFMKSLARTHYNQGHVEAYAFRKASWRLIP